VLLPALGVADEGDDRDVAFAAAAAALGALTAGAFELLLKKGDAFFRAAAADFELRLARAAAADAAGEAREGVVFLGEAGERLLELGELDLELAVARLGVLREDVEDELGLRSMSLRSVLVGDRSGLRRGELAVEG